MRELIGKFMPLLLEIPVVLLTSGHRCMWSYPKPAWVLAWIHPAGNGRNPWGFTQFNPILAYGGCPYLKRGLGSRPDTLILATDREGEGGHPTPKPVKVWKWLVDRTSPEPGELIYDPFLGSGTTLITCEMINRRCSGCEISPAYVDVIVTRWQNLTGKQATLEGHDGLTFEHVREGRLLGAQDAIKEEAIASGKTKGNRKAS